MVEALGVESLDRNAGFGIVVQERPLDRCCAAVAGQEGRVHIQSAVREAGDDAGGDEEAKGDGYDEIER